ncbi:MAG: hypothetical protein E6R03_12560 [Hyphomicrobiaceae bacterium]|nr:MAG: hypothetical protein E6R03_12560 [Hyphomicrobiaceae bacterium]
MKRDILKEINLETLVAPAVRSASSVNAADFDLSEVYEAGFAINVGALGGASTLALALHQKKSDGNYAALTDADGNAVAVSAFALTANKVYVGRIDARALNAGGLWIPTVRLVITTAVDTVAYGVLGIVGSRREEKRGSGEASPYPVLEFSTQHALMS